MANYRNRQRQSQRHGQRQRRNTGVSAKELKEFAYKMGRVEKGINNPDSQIFESYHRGASHSKKANKPLE